MFIVCFSVCFRCGRELLGEQHHLSASSFSIPTTYQLFTSSYQHRARNNNNNNNNNWHLQPSLPRTQATTREFRSWAQNGAAINQLTSAS